MSRPRQLEVLRMGPIAYGPMLAIQEERHRLLCAMARGQITDANVIEPVSEALYLLEHNPKVITLGKNTQHENLLFSRAVLEGRGYNVFEIGRGGDVTYHGPGQLVGYPILALGEGERDIQRYVWKLEELMIRVLADFGIRAERIEGLRGVWVGNEKIAAIGVRIARWVTMHGFALNVCTALSDFDVIVPCGLRGRGVTSMKKLLGYAPKMRQVEDRVIVYAERLFGRQCIEKNPSSVAPEADAEARERSVG